MLQERILKISGPPDYLRRAILRSGEDNMPAYKPPSPSMNDSLESLTEQLESLLKQAISQRPLSPLTALSSSAPAATNPAVARCVRAYAEAYDIAIQQPEYDEHVANYAGKFAYRQSLPPLIGRRNIRDFTACIAHGMLLNVIDTTEGTRILYAAQVAANTRNTQPARTQKKTQKSAEKRDKSDIPAPSFGEQPIQNE